MNLVDEHGQPLRPVDTSEPRRTMLPLTADGKPIISGDDSDIDEKKHRHDYDGKPKHGQEAIFMFPESYNELRRELVTYWTHTIWPQVAWRMAFRAEEFVETMNEILGVAVVFDTAKVDFICRTYLEILRNKRGAA